MSLPGYRRVESNHSLHWYCIASCQAPLRRSPYLQLPSFHSNPGCRVFHCSHCRRRTYRLVRLDQWSRYTQSSRWSSCRCWLCTLDSRPCRCLFRHSLDACRMLGWHLRNRCSRKFPGCQRFHCNHCQWKRYSRAFWAPLSQCMNSSCWSSCPRQLNKSGCRLCKSPFRRSRVSGMTVWSPPCKRSRQFPDCQGFRCSHCPRRTCSCVRSDRRNRCKRPNCWSSCLCLPHRSGCRPYRRRCHPAGEYRMAGRSPPCTHSRQSPGCQASRCSHCLGWTYNPVPWAGTRRWCRQYQPRHPRQRFHR